MADRFQGLSKKTTNLELAVNPVDALTGRPLRAAATVRIDGVHEKPRLNPSGYWLFLDPPVTLPADPITVTVDSPDRYVPRTREVTVGRLPTSGLRVDVYPSTAYAFAPDATLYEGVVTDGTDPVPGATVRIEHTNLETRTDTDGSFVLAVRGIVSTEAANSGDALRVNPNADNPTEVLDYAGTGPPSDPTLIAEHPAHVKTSVVEPISEGERATLAAPVEL